MIVGSCLCGKVKYQVDSEIKDIVHCHCRTCRKAHGSAFSSVAAVSDKSFTIQGQENLNSYESSEGKHRYFCRHCGTQVYAKRLPSEHIILRLGSVETDLHQTTEQSHIWLSEKANWLEVYGPLAKYMEFE